MLEPIEKILREKFWSVWLTIKLQYTNKKGEKEVHPGFPFHVMLVVLFFYICTFTDDGTKCLVEPQ